MTLAELRQQRGSILDIAMRYGASNVRAFGSVARGEQRDGSDLDLLVDLAPDRSLLDLGGLLMELREHLGTSVDVATERMLRGEIRSSIIAETVPL